MGRGRRVGTRTLLVPKRALAHAWGGSSRLVFYSLPSVQALLYRPPARHGSGAQQSWSWVGKGELKRMLAVHSPAARHHSTVVAISAFVVLHEGAIGDCV